jgi:hypothetical protein
MSAPSPEVATASRPFLRFLSQDFIARTQIARPSFRLAGLHHSATSMKSVAIPSCDPRVLVMQPGIGRQRMCAARSPARHPSTKYLSKGLTRSRTDNLLVMRSEPSTDARPQGTSPRWPPTARPPVAAMRLKARPHLKLRTVVPARADHQQPRQGARSTNARRHGPGRRARIDRRGDAGVVAVAPRSPPPTDHPPRPKRCRHRDEDRRARAPVFADREAQG